MIGNDMKPKGKTVPAGWLNDSAQAELSYASLIHGL